MKKITHIYAHRGANREAADNTRTAFDKALNYSIDGMETDVQLSRDGVPVLWHDRFITTLGYPEQTIDDFDYAQLERMDFARGKTQCEGVLSLKEFLARYRGRCRLQIEIKNRDWEALHRHQSKITQCIDLIGSAQDIFISSFNLDSLIFANSYAADFPLYYALRDHHTLHDVADFLTSHAFLQGLCLPIGIIDNAIIELLREHNKRIATYTCNSDEDINKALDFGVDELITDDPVKALAMRA